MNLSTAKEGSLRQLLWRWLEPGAPSAWYDPTTPIRLGTYGGAESAFEILERRFFDPVRRPGKGRENLLAAELCPTNSSCLPRGLSQEPTP